MTYAKAAAYGRTLLQQQEISDAQNDAWLLLAMVCQIDRNFYYLHAMEEMPQEQWESYQDLLRRRAEHVPLQYLTGEQEFMGHPFLVNPGVLIPRQDTEILVEEALKVAADGMTVLDLCTGSGCIIISIAKAVPGIAAVASDLSGDAVAMAEENARRNGVSVKFETGNLFEPLTGTYDLIVSNPPYIRTSEIAELMPEVRDFEPEMALDGREDGLFFYRTIIEEAENYLNPGGYLMFEIGYDQGEAVSELMRQAGYQEVTVIKDLAGLDRVVTGKEIEHV